MEILTTITLLTLTDSMTWVYSQRPQPFVQSPAQGLSSNTDASLSTSPTKLAMPNAPLLLDNYIGPVMQALAYCIDLLQYEPTYTTTIEPPFEGLEAEHGTTYIPPNTTPINFVSTTTTNPWWQSTSKTTTTKKPSTIWWQPPNTTKWTTTTKTSTVLWQSPTTIATPTTNKPSTVWWQVPSTADTTTKKPLITWGQTTTTSNISPSTITSQWWDTTSMILHKPPTTVAPWWQTFKPQRPIASPTPHHMPAIFAPKPPNMFSKPVSISKPSLKPPVYSSKPSVYSQKPTKFSAKPSIYTDKPSNVFAKPPDISKPQNHTKQPILNPMIEYSSKINKSQQLSTQYPLIMGNPSFYEWFFQPKSVQLKSDIDYNFQLLDPLPGALIQDILAERYEQPALLDNDNINELLRVYDDNFGRHRPLTGKKRVPPTKPYVDFLLLYDLLKRDAKAMNLNKYMGYTPKLLKELEETSKRSLERQIHLLMTRLLARQEVKRTDILVRIKSIIKDLENPHSSTSKSLRVFPPLQFSP